MKKNDIFQNVQTFGDIPNSRFGHTINLLSSTRIVLFGGATGDTGKYTMTNDTFSFNQVKRLWARLENKGSIPSARAAHGAVVTDLTHIMIYGGATGGGSLATDDLYLLEIKNEAAVWVIVPVNGNTPGRRYGHVVIFNKPFIVVFGGNIGQETVNDTWVLNIEKAPFMWQKIVTANDLPSPRVYHAAALCTVGSATGMIIVFGGRGIDQQATNDAWGLRKHRDGKWDWVKAPYKQQGVKPLSRYQHSILFDGPIMYTIGGRTNQNNENVIIESYNTESSEWKQHVTFARFRHTSFILDGLIYIHGGFENSTPSIPSASMVTFNMQLLNDDVEIVEEVKEFKFSELAHVATLTNNEEISKNVQKVSINSLEEANKKLSERPASVKTQTLKESHSSRIVLNALYKTKDCDTYPPIPQKLQISKDVINKLLGECLVILQTEPAVLSVRTPAKVFADLYGQYYDLLRYFSLYKGPLEGALPSDIDSFDYIFLGNYIDRGKMSLETILLILALKVKFPKQIHLLRGYHEIKEINKEYGFGEECKVRLEEDIDSPASVFSQINNIFDWFPVAAVLDNAIVCMHSGIGNIMDLSFFHKLQRPIIVSSDLAKSSTQQTILLDILQSIPLNDDEASMKSIKKEKFGKLNEFTMEKLSKFLNNTKLKQLIRGHSPLAEGINEWPNKQLCSIFSASNYGGMLKNPGCILCVSKTFKLIPKYIPAQEEGNYWIQTDEYKKRCPLSPLRKIN